MTNILAELWERLIWKYLPDEERVVRLRKHGLALVRNEAIRRAKAQLGPSAAIDARWQSEPIRLLSPVIEDENHVLDISGGLQATGLFPDWVVVLYPADAECNRRVERELDRMLIATRAQGPQSVCIRANNN